MIQGNGVERPQFIEIKCSLLARSLSVHTEPTVGPAPSDQLTHEVLREVCSSRGCGSLRIGVRGQGQGIQSCSVMGSLIIMGNSEGTQMIFHMELPRQP